ncbi:hypothetical protein JCM3765_007040 [Sporobolomyces pararoseus]
MTDYSAFAPARPPQSPTDPSAPSPTSSQFALAPHFINLQIDQNYPRANQQYQYQQQYQNYPREQSSFSQGGPPQLSNLNIPSAQFASNSSLKSPVSPVGGGGGFGYTSANRPRPNLTGGGAAGGNSPISPVGGSLSAGDSPSRVPRKSSLANNGSGMSPSNSHERLPPIPTSSSSMHFPKTFGSDGKEYENRRRDSNGGEAVFNGAALSSSTSQPFNSPHPQSLPPKAPPPAKKANPLEDLIATETLYVEDLGGVIKRVAAAWSRSNFPPPALDTMFRAVEAVYRINKTLLGKLNEIGPNPSSPKALGDLLMRWITDIEPAYSRYGSTLLLDFDSYVPVQSNPKLAPILSSLPWPGTLPSPDQYGLSSPAPVTLDLLFELPVHRIRYYKKLYAKLLRSTQEGRSDHALLVTANEKLAKLEQIADEGRKRSVLGQGEERHIAREQTAVPREEQPSQGSRRMPPRLDLKGLQEERNSGESGRMESPSSSSIRSSSATGTSTANTSTAALPRDPPLRVEELERRLATDKTLDIFSMQPRKCKLQMQPPSLTFQRQLRRACSAVVSFTPASDPAQQRVIHPRAYIILLTDLFLLCEWALPNETPSPNQDLTLLYPPLAGKHLRVSEKSDSSELEVSIMGKERLTIRYGGGESEARDWKLAMEEAARFGANYTASLRADSTSSALPRTPLSPISTQLPQIPRVLSPTTNQTLSPIEAQQSSFPMLENNRSLSRSPEPVSPNSNYSRQESFNSMGAIAQQPQFTDPRGGYGQVPSISRPDRSASIARNESPNSFIPSPSSTNFAGDNSSNGGSRGASPLRPDFSSNNSLPQPPFSPERQPPYQIHPQPGDFGGPGFVAPGGGGNYSSRPSSRTSQNSFGSSSNRTDRSSGYPEPPPPLPKERSYNGLNISGRGGPLYPTSMRTDPGDSRSVSGHSDYLSPHNSVHRSKSAEALRVETPQHYRMPSQALSEERSTSNPAFAPTVGDRIGGEDDSPPTSPVGTRPAEKTAIVADMRCKIFLQQHHSVWKSLGTAKLKLYQSMPSNTKQLVVDSDKSKGKTLISTIVLTDGVERVGKTGVAIELSDQGDRTGIIYMLQMKTEQSATGLFDQLLVGSDRARR